MIKSPGSKGRTSVTFTLDPVVGATFASVSGEWNDWSSDADPMTRSEDGGFAATIALEAGRAYRFRYLVDGSRWENDWAADAYVANGFGGDDSVVDLTAPGATRSAGRAAGARKVAARPASAKAATKKSAAVGADGADGAPTAKRVRKSPKPTGD